MSSENNSDDDLSDFRAKLNINAAEFKPKKIPEQNSELNIDKNETSEVNEVLPSVSQTLQPPACDYQNGIYPYNACHNTNGYMIPSYNSFYPNTIMNTNPVAQYLYYTQNPDGTYNTYQQPYYNYVYPQTPYIDYSQNGAIPMWYFPGTQNKPIYQPTMAINTNQLTLPQTESISPGSTMNMGTNSVSSNLVSPAPLSPTTNGTIYQNQSNPAGNHISPPTTCNAASQVVSPEKKTTTILSFNLSPLYRTIQNTQNMNSNPLRYIRNAFQNKLSNPYNRVHQSWLIHPRQDIRKKKFNTGNSENDKSLNALVKTINHSLDFPFQTNSRNTRFFVIKSFSDTNIQVSLKYGVWCSTPGGLNTLTQAYKDVHNNCNDSSEIADQPHIYLFFSVNTSGYFCGVAEMTSDYFPNSNKISSKSSDEGASTPQDPNAALPESFWQQKKWKGYFRVKWLYVKDVPNANLRHIHLEYNEGRSVTNSRDATEVKPSDKGWDVMRIIHIYDHQTSLLDDIPGTLDEVVDKNETSRQ